MNRPNGSGTVFKRGATWSAQITDYWINDIVDGKPTSRPHRKTKGGFKTKREAIAYLATMHAETEKTAPKLIDLWQRIDKTDVPKLSRAKQSSYKMARKRIESIIATPIDKLTLEDMQRCVDENADTYYTARDIKTLLSKMYERSIPDGYVNSNVARYIALPDLNESEPIPFEEQEVKTMWSAYLSGDTFVGYLLIMIYTGMMPDELRSCKTSMIDFDKCEIIGCGKKTTKRKETPIVFAECVKPIIADLSADKEYLCPLEKTRFYKLYHEAVNRIGVRDLPPYSCRHTTATEAAKTFANAQALKELMRHARITTTQRYIHLGSQEAHQAIDSILQVGANIGANDAEKSQ